MAAKPVRNKLLRLIVKENTRKEVFEIVKQRQEEVHRVVCGYFKVYPA